MFVSAEADRLGLDVQLVPAAYELQGATDLARALLQGERRPTAAFCFSDSIAYGVYAAAQELGIPIPAELSVIGYDDHPMSALLSPPLTSFIWGSKRVVEKAVGLLLAAIDSGPSSRRRVVIKPELCDRGSTAPPPA
jgi:LacI family transcriptional regulator